MTHLPPSPNLRPHPHPSSWREVSGQTEFLPASHSIRLPGVWPLPTSPLSSLMGLRPWTVISLKTFISGNFCAQETCLSLFPPQHRRVYHSLSRKRPSSGSAALHGVALPPGGPPWGCLETFLVFTAIGAGEVRDARTSGGQRQGMLLNIWQYTWQPPQPSIIQAKTSRESLPLN